MRKLMLLAAILAMAMIAIAPALAQVSQESEQDTESGDLDQSLNITGGGDNSNQCVNAQQAGNTGNVQNQIDLIQYASTADDFDFEDSDATIDVNPVSTTTCDQQVNQAASASG